MRCWLLKTEPASFSFDDLLAAPRRTTGWDGVRNYQARNYLRDELKRGDRVLIYHSNGEPPGVVGVAEVVREAHVDPTQFDPGDHHYDPRSKQESPSWVQVEVRAVEKLPRLVGLPELRANPQLAGMALLQRGQRLSVQPVSQAHFDAVLAMARSATRRSGSETGGELVRRARAKRAPARRR